MLEYVISCYLHRWWRAHNMVSEHAAATRGGHPWVYLASGDEEFARNFGKLSPHLRCQNPWFLAKEHVHSMWKIADPTDMSDE